MVWARRSEQLLEPVPSKDSNGQGQPFFCGAVMLIFFPWNSTLFPCSSATLFLSHRVGEFGCRGVMVMGMKKDKPDYGESRWYQFEITEDWEKHTIPVTVIFLLLL